MNAATIRAVIGGTLLMASSLVSASAAQPLPVPPAHPNSQRISVETQGTGTDVILIPGLASSRDVWGDLSAKLRKNHRIHLIELAGFANTAAIANPDDHWPFPWGRNGIDAGCSSS